MLKMFLTYLLLSFISQTNAYPIKSLDNPFVGSTMLVPNNGSKPKSSILLLHGSEGGSAHLLDSQATALTTLGYRVLVFCYFDCNRGLIGPRQTLKNVEITYVLSAISWLKKTFPDSKVGIYGFSRGAELALILASYARNEHELANFLIAHSPSDVLNGPANWSWQDSTCWLCKEGISKCSETSPDSAYVWNPACGPDDPNQIDFTKSAWQFEGQSLSLGVRIPIQNFERPILITVGEKDTLWPADQTKRIEATLKRAGRRPEIVYFPNGGHLLTGEDEIKRNEVVLDFLSRNN